MIKTFFKCLKCGQYRPRKECRLVNIETDAGMVKNIRWCAACLAKAEQKQTSRQDEPLDLQALLNSGRATIKKN